MKILFSILVLFTVIAVISCQREVDDNIPNIIDGPRIVKYIEIDTVFGTGIPMDTNHVELFSYDDQGRMKQHIYKYFYSQYPDIDIDTDVFYYNGTDTLPYKVIAYWSNADQFIDTCYLFYVNGVMVRDSSIQTNMTTGQFYGIDVDEFVRSGNSVTRLSRNYYTRNTTTPDNTYSAPLTIIRVNDNVTEYEDPTRSTVSYKHGRFTYDNHLSPFARIPSPYLVWFHPRTQKNLLIDSRTWGDDPANPDHFTYSYDFRPDGLPQTVRISRIPNPGDMQEGAKGTFYYE